MISPSPALNRAVLHVLSHAQLERGVPMTDAWWALIRDLSDHEAGGLGESLGLVLPLLRAEPDRLKFASDLAVTYDLYEATPHLLELAASEGTEWAWLATAALASHPGTDPTVAERLYKLLQVHDLPESVRRAIEIRLTPAAPTATHLERLLRAQRWPGVREAGYADAAVAPVVGIVEAGLRARHIWLLAHRLRLLGAEVRRIPSSFRQAPPDGWLGRHVPLVTSSPAFVGQLRRHDEEVTGAQLVVVDPNRLEGKGLPQVLRDIADRTRQLGGPTLVADFHEQPLLGDASALDRGVFHLGSYTAAEIAFLSGAKRDAVYRWSRRLDALEPKHVEGMYYWQFNHAVALRAYNWLQVLSGKRISPKVINSLAEFAGRDHAGEVAVTSAGEVIVVEDAQMHLLSSGQGVIPEVVRLDATFQPFQLGGGVVVPGLLEPTSRTRVHPAVLGGAPALRRFRIACTTISRLVGKRGRHIARAVYPFLDEDELNQAVDIGSRILTQR